MKHTILLFTLLFLICSSLFSCAKNPPSLVSLSGKTMGTTYSVKYANLDGSALQTTPAQIQTQIDKLLIDINGLMSTYIDDSELSLLNKAPANSPFTISPATNYVIQEALKMHSISNGMLDITVGPLVNSWGFGPTLRANKAPSAQQLSQIMEYVGVDKFTLSNMQVVKKSSKVYIDLSTIAKGYAVDEIAQLMQTFGINNFMVEIGGEMRVSGNKPNGIDWVIAIEKPVSGARDVQKFVTIGNNAIASSGDYRNYFEEDGIRYSHLIDPTTGYPIQHNLVAVSVVAPTSIEADGMATALMIMGFEAGRRLAEQESVAALFITKEGQQYVEYQSQEFIRLVHTIE